MEKHSTIVPSSFLVAVMLMGSSACAPEKPTPAPPPRVVIKQNQPPQFPDKMEVETTTKLERNAGGLLVGAVTFIEIKTPATDLDGDKLTYAWSGTDYNHGQFSTGDDSKIQSPSQIKADGLRAEWTRRIILGEPISGIIRVTVHDGHGGQAVHELAIGDYVTL